MKGGETEREAGRGIPFGEAPAPQMRVSADTRSVILSESMRN